MTKKCKNCNGLLTKQKSYCSRRCQAVGVAKQNTKAIREKRKCENCQTEFLFCSKWKSNINKRYCSRACKDDHQKTTYLGENNPMYGVSPTEETRELVRQSQKIFWSKEENIINHSELMRQVSDRRKQETGRPLGQLEKRKDKRKKTCEEKYGFEHPWKSKDIREKCEETNLKLYGKRSTQIAKESIPQLDTRIEKILVDILSSLKIDFVHPYNLELNSIRREFDFYLPDLNLLIECDGDYWHANPSLYQTKDHIQKYNETNDNIKNKLALDSGICLLRFWESDILKENFSEILSKSIWEKK
jgi:very-short-patch-repair endonuclease